MGQGPSTDAGAGQAAPEPPARLTAEALKQLGQTAQGERSDEEEESESFSSWRSRDSRPRGSLDTLSPMSQATNEGFAQRPSVDTPLQPSAGGGASVGGASGVKSGSMAPSQPRRASCSEELQRASGDGRRGSGAGAGNGPAAAPGRVSEGGSASAYSPPGSARSSFALERASMEANRASLEAFKEAFATGPLMPPAQPPQQPSQPDAAAAAAALPPAVTLAQLTEAAQLPASLRDKFPRLAVIPPNTPAPASMLTKLWQTDALDVKASLAALAAKGIINVAQLPDGRVWCLPQAQQLAAVSVACRDAAPAFHRALLDAYAASMLPSIPEDGLSAGAALDPRLAPLAALPGLPPAQRRTLAAQAGQGALQLQDIPDDGYILINLGHHLVASGRHHQLRELLLNPDWLRRKLMAAGTTAVVADFRRYLLLDNCADVKLVLEAFQLSAAQAVAYPRAPALLRCLMTGRLATAQLSAALQAWLADQRARSYEDGRAALLAGLPRCLLPLTASLDQAGGLQRLTLRGHSAPVTKVLLTPSGTDCISTSADGTCRVWDLDIGDCVLLLEGHAAPVNDAAITSDGSLVLTCSADGTARAFEMERGQCLRVLAGHTAAINALAMDPWARFVVTASSDGTARVWDLSSARSIHTLRTGVAAAQGGALCVALSPCTRFAIVGLANNQARMYDVISGQCMGVLAAHTGWVNLVRFLPDGKKALTGSHDGTARLWDLHTGNCRLVLEGHTGKINGLCVSPDGKWCTTASEDGSARVWDLRRGHCKRVFSGHKAWAASVAISPTGDKVVTTSGDGTAAAYSLETGDLLCLLEGHSGAVLDAVVTRKGRFAVTVSEDATVRVWDFAARLVQPPAFHEGKVYCMAGSSAGRVLATCGEDCSARLWDTERGTFKGVLQRHKVPIRWAAFSADGRQLVTASPDRTVLLWDMATLEVVRQIPVQEGSRLRSFVASADLSRAVLCKWDSAVTVVDLQAGEEVAVLQKWGERDSATGHTSAVNQVLMTEDGQTVVTLSKDCTARVWDATTGRCRHVLSGHTDAVLGGAIASPARLLATFAFDDCVRLWALDSGQCINTIRLPETPQHVALSPDGWKVAVGLASAAVAVVDVEDRQCGPLWEFHAGDLTGLQFSADGAELMTCSLDASVCVWDVATGLPTGLFVGDCGFTCCWYDGELEHLAVGTNRGIVHALDLGLVPRDGPGGAPPLAHGQQQHASAAATALAHQRLQPLQLQQLQQHQHSQPLHVPPGWEPGHPLPLAPGAPTGAAGPAAPPALTTGGPAAMEGVVVAAAEAPAAAAEAVGAS